MPHVLRNANRGRGAKRRFNLLKEEVPSPGFMKQGLPILAFFILASCVAFVGKWKQQPGREPSLPNPEILSQLAGFDEAGTSASEIPYGMRPTRGDPGREKSGPPAPEYPVSPDLEEETVAGHSTTERESPPEKVSGSLPVQANEQVFFLKAQAYHREKNLEMAAKMYWRVLHENPGHRGALFYLSSLYMEQSAYAKAYPLIMELMRRNPDDTQGLVNLAITEIAMGRPGKAIAYLDEALTLEDPPLFKIYFHQGVARSKLGRLEEAVTWYRKAEALDPGHTQLLFNMAVTYDRLERYKEALACYARFLKTDESSSPGERRNVETRAGILMAYLAETPKTPSTEGTPRQAEQEK